VLSFFFLSKSLLTQGARCRSQSWISHLGPGGSRSANLIFCSATTTTGVCMKRYQLVRRQAPCFKARLCIAKAHDCEPSWLSSLTARISLTGSSVSHQHRWTYRNVNKLVGSLVLRVAVSKGRAIVACPNLYLRAPSSITVSSTANGSTTRHRNYSTVDRRPSERRRFLMLYPCAHVSSLAHLRAVNVNHKVAPPLKT
jgi:hypothetical protein